MIINYRWAALALLAPVLQHLDRSKIRDEFLASDPVLLEQDGLRYCNCHRLVREALSADMWKHASAALSGVEFEYLEVGEGLRLHYHDHSDSVVIVLSNTAFPNEFEFAFEKPLGVGGYELWWKPLERGEVIFIPRKTVHGFRRNERASGAILHLVSASFPPIENDTTYVT